MYEDILKSEDIPNDSLNSNYFVIMRYPIFFQIYTLIHPKHWNAKNDPLMCSVKEIWVNFDFNCDSKKQR